MLKYFIFITLIFVSAAFAESIEDKEKLAQQISDTTMSPFCPGRTISACPSEQARNLRVKISDWLNQGYNEEAVKNQLIMIYGKSVTGKPEFNGVGVLAWIIPAVFVVLGIFLIKKRVKTPTTIEEIITDSNAEIQQELEKRLRN